MYILGFETTGARGSVALCNLETREIREKSTEEPMGHLRNITELASQLLRERGVGPSDLSGVAVSVGTRIIYRDKDWSFVRQSRCAGAEYNLFCRSEFGNVQGKV